MSFTVEYWDIPSGRGPYWIGPFSSIENAQRAHSGYELRASGQLYLIRRGATPGRNRVVAAILNQRWTDVPKAAWWNRARPHTLRQLRTAPASPLTNRLVIDVISAGGSVEGSVSATGRHQDQLPVAHQQAFRAAAPQQRPLPPSGSSNHSTRRLTLPGLALGWALVIAATAALALLLRHR